MARSIDRPPLAPRWRVAIGLSILITLLVAPAASARLIVPGASLDGVHIGQTKASVKRVLGQPTHVAAQGSDTVRWDYPAHNSLTVFFVQGRVIRVFVTAIPGRKVLDHTSKGVGLLSKMSAVSKAYPGHCSRPDPSLGAPPVCRWETATTRMLFKASGRYGTGWSAPVETIELQLTLPPH